MAHPRHNFLRELYHGSCGYCGTSEVDSGGELTVDHYHPIAAGGADADDNLVYACFRCKLYKGDYWATTDEVLRVLHPTQDHLELHYEDSLPSGHLKPLTETGRFHIALLRLNRPELVAARLQRQVAHATEAQLRLLNIRVQKLSETLAASYSYMRMLELALYEARVLPGPSTPDGDRGI